MDRMDLVEKRPVVRVFGRAHGLLAAGLLASLSAGCSSQQQKPAPVTTTDMARSVLDASYSLEHLGAGKVQFSGGAYDDTAAGVASRVAVTALGELDRDRRPDAAVILSTQSGGTGTFMDLYAVLDREGGVVSRGPASLGDRVKVDSLTIHRRKIAVYLVTHGPNDALCCPTERVVQTYELRADTLAQLGEEPR